MTGLPDYLSPENTNPSGPEDILLTVVSDTELGLSWKAPSVASPSVTKYKIEWDTAYSQSNQCKLLDPRGCCDFAKGVLASNSEIVTPAATVKGDRYQYKITGLVAGTEYFVRISAYNGVRGFGPAVISSPNTRVTAIRAPYVPETVTVRVSDLDIADQVEVFYTRPIVNNLGYADNNGGSTVTGYLIEYDVRPLFDSVLPANKGSYLAPTITGVSGYDTYANGTPCQVH